MKIERVFLNSEYSISRIIKGGWHLAGGHGNVSEAQAIQDMKAFVEAGITTFDCADIYTGVEEMIGKFMQRFKKEFTSGDLPNIQIHTKYVPDYDVLSTVKLEDTTKIIDRSLKRLGLERLDLVQFSWWDYNIPRYIETAYHLQQLQKEGKIRYIGATNFDGERLREILEAGIPILTNQVQFSILDQRVEKDSNPLMEEFGVKYLCYGVIAGGFISDKYLDFPEPSPPFENRSLTKYRLIIDEFGGYEYFQKALRIIRGIADRYQVGIAEVAMKYILQKEYVAAIIIGARNVNHLKRLNTVNNFDLDKEDLEKIGKVVESAKGPTGPFYALERDKNGKHAAIMKYNLNAE